MGRSCAFGRAAHTAQPRGLGVVVSKPSTSSPPSYPSRPRGPQLHATAHTWASATPAREICHASTRGNYTHPRAQPRSGLLTVPGLPRLWTALRSRPESMAAHNRLDAGQRLRRPQPLGKPANERRFPTPPTGPTLGRSREQLRSRCPPNHQPRLTSRHRQPDATTLTGPCVPVGRWN